MCAERKHIERRPKPMALLRAEISQDAGEPLRRWSGLLPLPARRGVSVIKNKDALATLWPSAPSKELRDIFLDVASTPPGQEGRSITSG